MHTRRVGLFLGLLVCAATTHAAVIELSLFSSDETPASSLSAEMTFTVVSSTLTLKVENTSEFSITQLYFNATSDVAGLTLTPEPGWTLATSAAANGFGLFDFALLDGVGPDPAGIMPGEELFFTLAIGGAGPFVDTAFTTEFSTIPPGDSPMIGAAKFIIEPITDDSAFGAVPEPTTLAGLALLGAFGLRRRR